MATDSELAFKSVDLPHCWVCQIRFTSSVPPGPAQREDHHVIPQAYGGTDGPTVSICETHHAAVHRIATALKASKPYHQYMGTRNPEHIKKLLWLSQCIVNAELATRDDPNKKAMVSLVLDARTKTMVDELKKVYPQLKSRAAVFKYAVEALHARNFQR